MLLEQGPALTFGHPAPHAELDAVVERIGTAFGDDRTVATDHGGFPLRGAPHEQLVGIGRSTQSFRDPGDSRLVSHLQ